MIAVAWRDDSMCNLSLCSKKQLNKKEIYCVSFEYKKKELPTILYASKFKVVIKWRKKKLKTFKTIQIL